MTWVAVGWDANNVRYFLNGEDVRTTEFSEATRYNHPGLAWIEVDEVLTSDWAPNKPGVGPDPEPPSIVRAKAAEVGQWVAVFKDPEGGESFLSRSGHRTEKIEEANSFVIEDEALTIARNYAHGIRDAVGGLIWRPEGIAGTSAKKID